MSDHNVFHIFFGEDLERLFKKSVFPTIKAKSGRNPLFKDKTTVLPRKARAICNTKGARLER